MKEFELTDQVDVCMFCEACCVDKDIDLSTTPGGDYVHLGGKIGKRAVCVNCEKDLELLVAKFTPVGASGGANVAEAEATGAKKKTTKKK